LSNQILLTFLYSRMSKNFICYWLLVTRYWLKTSNLQLATSN